MKKFDINELLKKIIMIDNNINDSDKESLIKQISYREVTSLQGLKIIEGILNYGIILSEEEIKKLPNVDCKKLNTALYLILKYYMRLDNETLTTALDSLLSINIDLISGGFYEKDAMAPISALLDILEDYATGSNPVDIEDYDISDNEISLYEVKVDYGNKEKIRDFERTLFS